MEKSENGNGGKHSGYFSKRLKAGKRRTYFFDVKSTRQGDFFLTITESKKNFDTDGYESHKIFLYKEDFRKFVEGLNEALDYVKKELLPDYDFESERPERNNSNPQNDNIAKPRPNKTHHTEEIVHKKPAESISDTTTVTSTATPHINDDEEVDWN